MDKVVLKEQVLEVIFAEHFGDEGAFSDELYFSWSEGRKMQEQGQLSQDVQDRNWRLLEPGHNHRVHIIPPLGVC